MHQSSNDAKCFAECCSKNLKNLECKVILRKYKEKSLTELSKSNERY